MGFENCIEMWEKHHCSSGVGGINLNMHSNKEVGKFRGQLKESWFRGIITISTTEGHEKRCPLLDLGCDLPVLEDMSVVRCFLLIVRGGMCQQHCSNCWFSLKWMRRCSH